MVAKEWCCPFVGWAIEPPLICRLSLRDRGSERLATKFFAIPPLTPRQGCSCSFVLGN